MRHAARTEGCGVYKTPGRKKPLTASYGVVGYHVAYLSSVILIAHIVAQDGGSEAQPKADTPKPYGGCDRADRGLVG